MNRVVEPKPHKPENKKENKKEKKIGTEVEGSEDLSKSTILVKLQDSNLLLILLVISFIAFLATREIMFAVTTGALIISVFFLDIIAGIQRHGFSKELIEIGIAVIIALAVWFSLVFLLNTSSPVSAIVSCSMLPAYERGDLIILRGVPPSEIKAQAIEVDQNSLNVISSSLHSSCGQTQFGIDYQCGSCVRTSIASGQPGQERFVQCVKGISVNGKQINEDLTNDVIVYTPQQSLSRFQGDIIHRAYAKLTAGNKTVILTKGDNNDYFDSSLFGAVPQENVKGKVLLRIPYLGYLKLFISGFFSEPAGCDTVLQH